MFYKSISFNFFFLLYLLLPFIFWEGFGVFYLNGFAIGCYLISSFSLAQLCVSKNVAAISCSFWIFVYIFLVISAVSQQVAGYYPWPNVYDEYDLLYGWALIFFCNVAFYFFNMRSSSREKLNSSYNFSKRMMRLFIPFSIVLTVFALNQIGGFSNLFLSRDEFSEIFEDNIASSMITQALFRIPFFVVSLYFLDELLTVKLKNERFKAGFYFFIFFSLTVILNNPISTPRFWVACILITYALIVANYLRMNVNRFYVTSLIFLTIFVFPVSDVFRRSVDVSILDYFSETNISEGFIYSPNYDSFQQIINAVVYVENNGHSYGGRSLSALFFWVPRSVIPSKYISSGEDIGIFFKYEYTNLSAPLWAEMYLDFGFLGAVLAFFGLGYLVGSLDRSLSNRTNVVVFFIAAYGMYFLRGTLLSVIGFLVVTLVIFWLLQRKKL